MMFALDWAEAGLLPGDKITGTVRFSLTTP